MFAQFFKDLVTIAKPDGTVVSPAVRADVQTKMIFINDASLPIEVGDVIFRTLPSGVVEAFVVEDPGFHAAFGGIPAGYQIKVRRKGSEPKPHTVNYNLTGPNSRINIASHDASQNVVNASGADELFASLRNALETGIAQENERLQLLEEVERLKATVGTRSLDGVCDS